MNLVVNLVSDISVYVVFVYAFFIGMNLAESGMYHLIKLLVMAVIIVEGMKWIIFSEASWWGKVLNTMILLAVVTIASYIAARVTYSVGGRINR